MELSPSPSDANEATTQNRRKSGRVTKKPSKLSEQGADGSVKRKRAAETEDDEHADSEDSSAGDSEDDESLDDGDNSPPRRKARKTGAGRGKQQSSKRSKTNGATTDVTIRVAADKSASRKDKRMRKSALGAADGLYAQVFGQDENLDIIAMQWLASFKKHESNALADFVNFVLRCAGCEHKVTAEDIEDPDNCASRLIDVQDMFQSHDVVDYPLIARSKGAVSFRKTLNSFIHALIRKIGEADLLYEQTELIDNIQIWVGTMSSAATRPFRHTSAIVSLSIISALCEIGRTLVETRAKSLRQSEGEQKKGRVNKGRVKDLQKRADETADRKSRIDEIIKEWFDVVFVHRYRDVDPKIRVDCVTYLSHWILTYPDVFFDDQHLRYLGWVLSDSNAATRHEVIKQLLRLFKDKDRVTGLKQFTERFRPRLVEIATRDGEVNVRASAIELLDVLRDAGLLEPNDIDAIGKLIFDVEPRIRKAVVGFFASNINDMFELKIEDVGGAESIEEFPGPPDDTNLDNPRLDWLQLKSLAEVLWSYDSQDEDEIDSKPNTSHLLSVGSSVESRFGLAAEALIEHIDAIQQWQVLAAYLLFDHSRPKSKSTNAKNVFLQACKLEEKEESILLEILNVSVKYGLTKAVEAAATFEKKPKKLKGQKQQGAEHEEAAQRLATIIPKLLSKYGATPESASAVLRLEHVLNLDIFQDLRQDSNVYSNLLDNVKKQFMSHENQDVLAEASIALLHAKSFEESEELTDEQLQMIWEDTTHTLVSLCQGKTLTSRGNISESTLNTITNAVLRISYLASISSCVEPLETVKTLKPDKSRKKQIQTSPIACLSVLIDTINRGVPSKGSDPDIDSTEDLLAINAIKCLQFYFMWKVRALQMSITSNNVISNTAVQTIVQHRDATFAALRAILQHRHGVDDVRLAAAGSLVELSSLFTSLRHVKSSKSSVAPSQGNYLSLVQTLDSQTQALILQTFVAAEAAYAKKTRRALEAPSYDDEPEGSDDEDGASNQGDDNAAVVGKAADAAASTLLAEERLCSLSSKIAIAIIAGVISADSANADDTEREGTSLGKRLLRNKARLGNNFREICNFVEMGGLEKKKGASGLKSKTAGPPAKKLKSAEVVDEESEEEDIDDEDLHSHGHAPVDEVAGDEEMDMLVPDDMDMQSLLGD